MMNDYKQRILLLTFSTQNLRQELCDHEKTGKIAQLWQKEYFVRFSFLMKDELSSKALTNEIVVLFYEARNS
jgi:hypothetical protein